MPISEWPFGRRVTRNAFFCLRPPRCVSTGPVVVRLAEMANKRERGTCTVLFWQKSSRRNSKHDFGLDIGRNAGPGRLGGAALGVHRCEDAVATSRRHPDRQKHPRTAQVVGQDDARRRHIALPTEPADSMATLAHS